MTEGTLLRVLMNYKDLKKESSPHKGCQCCEGQRQLRFCTNRQDIFNNISHKVLALSRSQKTVEIVSRNRGSTIPSVICMRDPVSCLRSPELIPLDIHGKHIILARSEQKRATRHRIFEAARCVNGPDVLREVQIILNLTYPQLL
jgi:hypothetical protein